MAGGIGVETIWRPHIAASSELMGSPAPLLGLQSTVALGHPGMHVVGAATETAGHVPEGWRQPGDRAEVAHAAQDDRGTGCLESFHDSVEIAFQPLQWDTTYDVVGADRHQRQPG